MADVQAVDNALLYNQRALGYLCDILFHPNSVVAAQICARWARYSPSASTTLHTNLVTLLRAIFEAPAKLEFAEAYIQVFDSPALHIPKTILVESEALRLLVPNMLRFFRRTTLSQTTFTRSHTDYQYNRELDCIADRAAIALGLVRHILATAPPNFYRATRDALNAAATSLYYDYYNRSGVAVPGPGVAFSMTALENIASVTGLHSPIIRVATPEQLQLRLSSSNDERDSTPTRLSNSPSSIFYVSYNREEFLSLPEAQASTNGR